VVGVDQAGEPATEALTRLRAAAAAVADLDRPAHDPPLDDAIPGDAIPGDTIHGHGTPGETTGPDAGFDATAHADRFSELHDALVTVLADVDRG
jgi:hypothetical protein